MAPISHSTLMIACGALAREILALKANLKLDSNLFELRCLPAKYHNFPDRIVPGLEAIIAEVGDRYDRILIGYGDCGTGGGLDRFLAKHPKISRMPGAHCYATFAGLDAFDAMMEEELGTFFLTDYLAAHFETLIIKGFGIDRYPNLKETYFEHYKRLVYLSQTQDAAQMDNARKAAETLGLEFEHRPTGYGELQAFMTPPYVSKGAHV